MKLYTRKKSQVGKVLIFLCLAIVFMGSTGFLAKESMNKYTELTQTKNQLSILEASNKQLEASRNELKTQEDQVKTQVDALEDKLQELKIKTPDVNFEVTTTKYAYLTFDDGPSKNTPKILDFLKVNDIKATFFVVGVPGQEAIYKRIFDEGHTLAVHSYSHEYPKIYRNVDAFMADIYQLSDLLEGITGVKPNVLRFPGGSNNSIGRRYGGSGIMEKVIAKVEEDGFVYFDWNVDSMDAATNNQEAQVIVDAVLSQAKNKDPIIVLLHDAAVKTTTVEALPEIVQGLKNQGFIFQELTSDVQPIQFR